jgi:hypothetical protein
MSSGGGGGGPSAAEIAATEKASAQDYWGSYSKWQGDALERRDTNIKRAGRTLNQSDRTKEILIANENQLYDDEMKSLIEGEHGLSLDKYFKQEQAKRKDATMGRYEERHKEGFRKSEMDAELEKLTIGA